MRAHPCLNFPALGMASGCSRECDRGHHRSGFPWCPQWLHHQPEEIHQLLHLSAVLHHPRGRPSEPSPAPAHPGRQWVLKLLHLSAENFTSGSLCNLFSSDLVSDEDLSHFSMGVPSACGKYLIFLFHYGLNLHEFFNVGDWLRTS